MIKMLKYLLNYKYVHIPFFVFNFFEFVIIKANAALNTVFTKTFRIQARIISSILRFVCHPINNNFTIILYKK
jgi:hypothetical protein